ncbi:hypothetical protein CJE1877 [Campylobacter jejuni RM1221]|nr:hypothetical protein CJE1877 [Campylobacter jejuni RM1221]ALF92693.1 hypothetical protein CjjRM3197_1704 [Campylobacter jejuni subsp. jejuni]ALF94332.1 hypothetical protein CjjRM3196_1704 [Campylobacter jejuni subsp. jejuni]ANS24743.1 hypothetical protein CjjRM1285_1703 [Campylobacter jejuni subsp. jejuni]AOW98016.1 hypothetical protein CjjRM3420_1700 [Campylobacter jejuni subsp. jejuni str. RM3420]
MRVYKILFSKSRNLMKFFYYFPFKKDKNRIFRI